MRASIEIFPDTGHHFYFVPFQPEHLQSSPDIANLCTQDTAPWRHVTNVEGAHIPWIRARLTKRFEQTADVHGIMLAVESNIGRINRGWRVRPKRKITPEDPSASAVAGPVTSPYAHAEVSDIPKQPQALHLIVREDLLNPPLEVGVELEITWNVAAAKPIDVDLVVDFGNTRTVAVAIEHNQAANGLLSQICRPIRFSTRSDERPFRNLEQQPNQTSSINPIDSWFVLHETLFANQEPNEESPNAPMKHWTEEIEWESQLQGTWPFKKNVSKPTWRHLRIPQICVQLSPALMGPEATQILTQLPVQAGGNFLLSSPKRYLWDDEPVGHMGQIGLAFWTMYLNRWNPDFTKASDPLQPKIVPKLSATVLRLLNQDGRDWTLGDDGQELPPNERTDATARPVPNPDEPAYPRSDALTWAALTVLETAYRNITSADWRTALGQRFVKRRLRSVTVTFPPGWTGQELAAYRRKWQKAVDIFSMGHLPNRAVESKGGDRPVLLMQLDEAVASQLPLVFSEVKRLGNIGENWIELVGRGKGKNAKARIMNIDIGGGTTDIAIIEYRDEFEGPGVHLVSNLLYRDSSTIAGDALVRRVIEAVILPALSRGMNTRDQEVFNNVFCNVKKQVGMWRRITRQVFIPIAYRWLQDLTVGKYNQPETGLAPTPQEILGDVVFGQGGPMDDFAKIRASVGLPDTILNATSPLNYDQDKLKSCITETFYELFHSLGKAVEAFDCDLVFMSGKPSELPPLRPLLEESLPLLPHRIVFASETEAGSWYPLSSDGRINDAKTPTVAGAALNQAIRNGLIPNWQIKREVSPHLPKRNFWGLMPDSGKRDFGRIYLQPNDDENTCTVMIGARIGRRLLPSKTRPEPVYELRWRDSNRYRQVGAPVNVPLDITIRRVASESLPDDKDMPNGEYLKISAVKGEFDGKPIATDDVYLRLCTIETDEYWMDSCIFHPERTESFIQQF